MLRLTFRPAALQQSLLDHGKIFPFVTSCRVLNAVVSRIVGCRPQKEATISALLRAPRFQDVEQFKDTICALSSFARSFQRMKEVAMSPLQRSGDHLGSGFEMPIERSQRDIGLAHDTIDANFRETVPIEGAICRVDDVFTLRTHARKVERSFYPSQACS
ncbi:hypothetical protein [Mesorhizobium sp. 1M-11]|uniref:hypothetical protein n=1 Tax=Mesorhizobium sp. 1M-11 TaxID=1529006 RepID=UPI001FCDF342|nr:hypothetical protein [Mesorhizobium sp. 1M-11]